MKHKPFSLLSFSITLVTILTSFVASIGISHAQAILGSQVQVLKSIAVQDKIRPHQSAFPEAIRANLIKHVNTALDQKKPIRLFGETKKWHALSKILSKTKSLTKPGIQLLKIELSSQAFTLGKLTLSGIETASVYHNGQLIKASDKQYSLTLNNAEHRLLILAEQVDNWKNVKLDWKNDNEDSAENSIVFHQQPTKHRLKAKQLYDSETISNISLSPDAKQLVWTKRSYADATGDQATTQTELVDATSAKVLYRWQGFTPSSLTFSTDDRYISYSANNNLYLLERKTLSLSTVAQGLEGASNFNWLNDDTLVFSWNRSAEKQHKITKRYRALEDRWSGWRNNSQLYLLDIHSGFIKQLTQHKLSHNLLDIDSKNNRLLLSREPVNYKQAPHALSQLLTLDITSGKEQLLGEYRTFSGAAFSKKGIYISAGPGFSNGAGTTLPTGQAVNNYDGQLYLRDKQGKIQALSKQFDPSISRFDVLKNGDLVLRVTEQDRSQLYFYKAKSAAFTKISSKLDVVNAYSVSQHKKATLVYHGTSVTSPQQVYIKAYNKSASLLFDSTTHSYANSQFASIKEWDFKTPQGDLIDGRYYLPPGFDANKKYPMITYYYGGTSPVTRAFTGRWPFSLWASQGYVVYVVQPSGATGYGQEFSARHVNAWGKQTADDIINATQAFIKQHSFIDEKRVGNMGASYGGFMTMYLATKTDMFRASISHAGISNLSEYWGYGWWGYGYSGVASEGSFPWNNKPLYIEQSPLFNADKINTPLLLLHGDADTNVPVSESHQMYTALKLLDKEVELIEFINDNHHINARSHRLRWWSTILAYFDKELKDQPLWWNTLYPAAK
jgi:dipeptidyl aminopeptidase/acylaminoacyl peptidase